MSSLAQYQSVFRVAKPDATKNFTQSWATKRNRQSVSCLACRSRKLKCDRQVPCSSCSKRGSRDRCSYPNGGQNGYPGPEEGFRASEAQLRLQKLEELVTSLIERTKLGSEGSSGNTNVDSSLRHLSIHGATQTAETSLRGHLDFNGSETFYVGATHWATILENIRDIQDALEPDADEDEEAIPTVVASGLDIVLDTTPSLTLTDFCNSLPPRGEVDKLLSIYFRPKTTQPPIIHSGKFLKEYRSFWDDPSSVSLLWISMLFSALHVASHIDRANSNKVNELEGGPARPTFITRAGQALVAGKYHQASPYCVEALLLYGICKFMQKKDPDTDAWMIMGISARLAFRMGYHRDPRHLTNITPFEGEMRRRTFYVVEIFDLLFSFQAGLPPIIHEEECDTESPSNLFDTDFDEDCKALPPSRPETDPTPMLYFCYKFRLANLFRRVIRHALSLKAPIYEDIMRLDGELHEMRANVPPSLRMRPLSSSITDEAYTILNRLNIELMYLQSLCVLHRNYLSQDRSNPNFDYSRMTCTDAALRMLEYQAEVHFACLPGGQLFNDGWMLTSVSLQAFLLAAMILSLDLYESHERPAPASPDTLKAQGKKYDALRLSYEIWTSRKESSRDMRRASKVLEIMLSRVPRPNLPPALIDPHGEISNGSQAAMNEGSSIATPTGHLGTPLWKTNVVELSGQGLPMDSYAPLDPNSVNSLNTIFSDIDDINWGLVDQCLLSQRNVDDIPFDWQ